MERPQVNVEELRRGGVVALKENKFSIWVKTACCNLNAQQIRKLADITDKYGRGILLFTSRQIPIIPFVDLADVPALKRELQEVEMELDRCGSRVRNLNVCYEDKLCPEAVVNCLELGEKLEKFFGSQILHKIKIGVSGCSRNCTSVRTLSDIGFIGTRLNGRQGYAAYVGGRLGLNPSIGLKMAELLTEDECVKLVQNYFDLLASQGQKGERAADVLQRLGLDQFKHELTRGLKETGDRQIIACPTKVDQAQTGRQILRLRATCGELNSSQVRAIADIAEKYGNGFVHFPVRGSPEIPGVDSADLGVIRQALVEAHLELIENGVENFQSCFGNYCLEALADPQNLLRRIQAKLEASPIDNLRLSVSACGCPNSCGIANLSDIGFHGVSEPWVDVRNCTGCGLCLTVCKRKAIVIEDKKAVIDMEKCGHCGQCAAICPLSAVIEKRKGFAVLLGGKDGRETRLGTKIAEFVSEAEAFKITERLLAIVKAEGGDAAAVIDKIGLDNLRARIVPVKKSKSKVPADE